VVAEGDFFAFGLETQFGILSLGEPRAVLDFSLTPVLPLVGSLKRRVVELEKATWFGDLVWGVCRWRASLVLNIGVSHCASLACKMLQGGGLLGMMSLHTWIKERICDL
jgi:hypothetical protein